MNALLGGVSRFTQVPVKYQKTLLGLDRRTLAYLRGGKGFDIGCGKGVLVENLREKQIDFEGIDPEVEEDPDKPYLIKQLVTGVYPMAGSIPKPDSLYDIVVAFQNASLNRGFTLSSEIKTALAIDMGIIDMERHTNAVQNAQCIIWEGTRILKPGQRFVVYPQLDRLEDVMGKSILESQGIKVASEPVDVKAAKEYFEWERGRLGFSDLDAPEERYREFGFYSRTVLTKT